MADIEEVITGDTSELVEALQEGTDAATELADALDRIRDALAELDEAGEAAEAAAEELDEVRDAAEQAEAAVDSLSESGAGLDDIAAGASGAAEGLARVRDESAEAEEALDALVATGPGLDDIEAFLEQDAEAAAGLRDNLVEAAAAEDAVTASAAGLGDAAPALEGDAAAAGHLRDNLLEAAAAEEAVTIQGASLDRVLQRVKNNLSTMNVGDELKTLTFSRSGVGWQMVTPELPEDADETLASLADLVKGTDQYRTSVLGLSQDMLSAGQAAGDWEKQIANANAALAEADKFIGSQSGIIDDLGDATSDFVPKFDAETQAIRDFNNAWSDFQASGSWVDLARVQAASEALGPALADASASGEEIEQTFGGIEEAGQGVAAGLADAALGLQDVEQAAGAAASPLEGTTSLLSQLAETAGDAWEKIPWFGVGIGALVVGLLGIAPALVATVSGFVSFGVLAYPALEKVKDGYDAVNKAQTAYEASVAKEKSDPTAAHLADEDKALKSLKATWAGLPTPVSDAVTAIKQFEKAWDQTSAKSGIQNAAIGDISLVLRAATDMLPAFTTLAKAASPVISGLWTNIDKNLDSSGWDKFVSSMAKEAAPAAAAFHTVATGVSDYLSAFQEKGAGASNQFITSFGKLLKTTAPDSVTATINGIKMLTSAINGLNAAAKNPDIDALGHGIDNMLHAGGELDRIGSKFDKAFFTGSYLPPWLSGKPVPVKIGPVDTSALKRSLGESLSTLPPLTPTVNTAALKRSLSIGALDQTVLVHAKVDKVDTTALKQTLSGQSDLFTKAKVNADTSDLQRQVTQASKDVTIGGVKVSLSDAKLSGLAALQPLLGQAGKTAGDDFTKAIIDAITSGDTSAEGAAKRLADDIRSGLSALPGQARSVGIDVGAGLAAGIEASTPGAVAAAASMAAQVEAAARTTLGTHSPSTVFYKIGTETWQGFVLGLQGGKSQVQAAINDVLDQASPYNDSAIQSMIDKMREEVRDATGAGVISPGTESVFLRWLQDDNRRLLQPLAARRQAIEAQISAERSLAASIQSAEISASTVASAWGDTYQGQATTTQAYGTITQALQAQLAQTRQFRDDIIKLKREGLGESSIESLLSEGVTGGQPIAEQLLAGGKSGIRQINELESQIAAASKALGITGANAAYESGSQIGEGLAAGLRSELGKVDNEMQRIANELVRALRQALRISSPSRATMEIGYALGDGLVAGMDAKGSAINAAAARMAAAAIPGYRGGAHATALGGAAEVIEIRLTQDQPIVIGGKQVARVNQKYTLQHARRNTKSGYQLRGRGI